MGNRLYVGNISFQASEDDLKELFSKAGTVASTKLITDAATGRPRGFGFVEMNTDAEAQKAVEMLNGSNFLERSNRVLLPFRIPLVLISGVDEHFFSLFAGMLA